MGCATSASVDAQTISGTEPGIIEALASTPSTPAADSKTPGVDWDKRGARECKEGGWINDDSDGGDAMPSAGGVSHDKPRLKLALVPTVEPIEQVRNPDNLLKRSIHRP